MMDRTCLYKGKVYYTGDDLTPDIECSLLPPCVMGPEAAETDHYSAEKRKWQSAPSICTADGKTLFCAFSGDNYGGDEQPNNYNVIMRSEDGGISWRTVNVIDHPDSVRMHEPILWMDKEGMLWHFWAQSYNWWDGRGGVWAMKASPDTLKWSEPKRICDGVLATTPLLLKDGGILLPVSIWKHFPSKYHSLPELEESSVYISDDGGESFAYVGGAMEMNTTFDENAVTERDDGSLYMVVRCTDSIAASVSDDRGRTWSTPFHVTDHCSSRSWIAKLPSGHHLLVTNDDDKRRCNMTAFLSTDGCRTWSAKMLLDERFNTSYPAGCVTTDGRVYVAYDFNRYQEEEVYFASFTEEDILKGSAGEGSYLKRLVSKGLSGKVTDKIYESGEV